MATGAIVSRMEHRTNTESTTASSAKDGWLWGLSGSGFNLILYGLFLYKLKREVPANDYRDFQVIWWSSILSLTMPILLLGIADDWALGVLVAKGAVVAFSIPVFLVVQTADINGFVIQKLFGGINTRNPLRPLFGIVLLLGVAAIFLFGVECKGFFSVVITLTALNVNLILLWWLLRILRVAISEK